MLEILKPAYFVSRLVDPDRLVLQWAERLTMGEFPKYAWPPPLKSSIFSSHICWLRCREMGASFREKVQRWVTFVKTLPPLLAKRPGNMSSKNGKPQARGHTDSG